MFNRSDHFVRAVAFATAAHADQTRRYSGRPYIEHPVAVARMASRFAHDDDMLLAAVLHDTVEDTAVTIEDVACAFGQPVALLVADLTDVSRLSDGSRAVRKRRDLNVAQDDRVTRWPRPFSWSTSTRLCSSRARNRCTPERNFATDTWTQAKRLKKLRQHGYDLARVVMVDDSPDKHTRNYGNLVQVVPFFGDAGDAELYGLAPYLAGMFRVQDVRAVEKRGWARRATDRLG